MRDLSVFLLLRAFNLSAGLLYVKTLGCFISITQILFFLSLYYTAFTHKTKYRDTLYRAPVAPTTTNISLG